VLEATLLAFILDRLGGKLVDDGDIARFIVVDRLEGREEILLWLYDAHEAAPVLQPLIVKLFRASARTQQSFQIDLLQLLLPTSGPLRRVQSERRFLPFISHVVQSVDKEGFNLGNLLVVVLHDRLRHFNLFLKLDLLTLGPFRRENGAQPRDLVV